MNNYNKLQQSITILLRYSLDHEYEDVGYDYSWCNSCEWNSRDYGFKNGTHLPNCELMAARDILETFRDSGTLEEFDKNSDQLFETLLNCIKWTEEQAKKN